MAAPYLRSGHPINNNPNNMYSRNGGNNSSSAYPRNRVEEANLSLMEMENNQRWAELGEQVDLLKELSKDIHQEVRSQNQMLDGMGMSFNNVGEMFQSTMGKLGVMLNSSNGRHMYYLAIFVVFVFIVIYYSMSSRK